MLSETAAIVDWVKAGPLVTCCAAMEEIKEMEVEETTLTRVKTWRQSEQARIGQWRSRRKKRAGKMVATAVTETKVEEEEEEEQ